MILHETTLPWRNEAVLQTANLTPWLLRKLSADIHPHLPSYLAIAFDPGIHRNDRQKLIQTLPDFFSKEFSHRNKRIEHAIRHGDITASFAETHIYSSTHQQPWLIYESPQGGLPENLPDQKTQGMVPCSSMPNHGVAWRQDDKGAMNPVLVTARKANAAWDFSADFGHESGHAAFSPVPLFLQSPHVSGTDWKLDAISSPSEIQQGHIARLMYIHCEWAVIAARGEQRPTKTGLPVTETPEEAYAALKLSHDIAPMLGFDQAHAALERQNGFINPANDSAIWALGQASIQFNHMVQKFMSHGMAPCLNALVETIQSYPSVTSSTPLRLRNAAQASGETCHLPPRSI